MGSLCLFLAVSMSALAAETQPVDPKLDSGLPGPWVSQLYFRRIPAVMRREPGEEQHWLLMERQINAATSEDFVHSVRQMLTPSGVQNGATLNVEYDPSYQSLSFHWVRILRGTNTLDALDLAKVKLIQREKELEDHIYSGRQSAVLVLADVRVGDLLDCAYTIRGANPVMAGKFSGAVPVRLDRPVENLVTRLVWPERRRLFARNHGCTVQPAVGRTNDFTVYTWTFRQVPALHVEDSLPAWYEPQPWVQLSESQTWGEVNRWAMELFSESGSFSPELAQKIAGWRRIADRESQVLSVLRFVQEEVRYFGIEMGASSHQPSGSSEVFGRRFGDCKDKCQLFISTLRALGIEAYPVLVNTTARRTLQEWQPSSHVFDHVIAVVRMGENVYWLDPTANYQRGPLVMHELPYYGFGLVISPKTTGLTPIPAPTARGETRTTEYFTVRSANQPADLKVVTVATGRDADRMRAAFATTPRFEMEKAFQLYYSQMYPGTKKAQPFALADDELQNRFEVTQTYTIDKFWDAPDKAGHTRCEFFPHSVRDELARPAETDRAMPVGVNFPRHEIWRTEVILPKAWPQETRSKTVSDPAFSLQMNLRCLGARLEIEYEYRALNDFVPATRAREYSQHLDDAAQLLGYLVTW